MRYIPLLSRKRTEASTNIVVFFYSLNEQALINVVRYINLKIVETFSNEYSIHTFITTSIQQSMFFN